MVDFDAPKLFWSLIILMRLFHKVSWILDWFDPLLSCAGILNNLSLNGWKRRRDLAAAKEIWAHFCALEPPFSFPPTRISHKEKKGGKKRVMRCNLSDVASREIMGPGNRAKLFTALEPQNLSIGEFYAVQKRGSMDFKDLKLRKAPSGTKDLAAKWHRFFGCLL